CRGKNFVGSHEEEGRSDSDERDDSGTSSVEQQWLERWSFGVSPAPFGLGLTDTAFWALSHREVQALRKRFVEHRQLQITLIAGLRADVRNAAGWTKSNKEPWQPWDLGAPEPTRRDVLRRLRSPSKEQVRSYFQSRFPDKSKPKVSVLGGLNGQV